MNNAFSLAAISAPLQAWLPPHLAVAAAMLLVVVAVLAFLGTVAALTHLHAQHTTARRRSRWDQHLADQQRTPHRADPSAWRGRYR